MRASGRPQQPELRTPLAWRHRDMSFNHSGTESVHNLRPSSPSVTSTSSDDREEVPMVRHPPRSRPASRSGGGSRLGERPPSGHHHHHHHHLPPSADHFHYAGPMGPGYRSGTLRSTRSVPALALATWDGEPCPVHGHGPPVSPIPPLYASPSQLSTMRRYGSMYDIRSGTYASSLPPPPPVIMTPQPPPLEKKSFHGSMQMLGSGPPSPFGPPGHPTLVPSPHVAPHLFPPMMRPRPLVFPAMAEPLPMRDPFKMRTPPPGMVAKADDTYSVDEVCCKGHLIVLWIILGVVTVGVILGIVLGVTIN